MDKFIGTILDNRYELLEVIGVGGTAVVYKAKCHRLNRYVAVKILKEEYAQDEEFRRKFHDEAQAVAMLSHPNIVNVYDVSRSGSIEYIVMELIDGITLKEYLSRRGQLSPKEVTVFATQIARALEHAHSHNIIHRDIKPQNIMLLRDGTVKVADFGIAHFTNNDNTYCKGEAIGSVHYVSPEQAKGSFVDNRTDLYSLGVVMYEMITGRLPFEGDTPVSIALQHINSIALPPSIFAENVPPQLEEITMKAMNPSLSKRYTSAAQILKDLEEFQNEQQFKLNIPREEGIVVQEEPQDLDATRKLNNTGEVAALMENERREPPERRETEEPRHGEEEEAPVEEQKEKQKKHRSPVSAALIFSVVAVVVFCVGAFCFVQKILDPFGGTDSSKINAPNLKGLYYSQVIADPQYSNVVIAEGEYVYNETVDAGKIISQEPEANRKIDPGATITVTISRGNRTFALPNYVNSDARQAKIELDRFGVQCVEAAPEYNDEIENGFVIRTDPAAGTMLTEGDTVTITVSRGPEFVMVDMPNLMGKPLNTALELLDVAGLEWDEPVYTEADGEPDLVIYQSIAPGTQVEKGTRVSFQLSKERELPPEPVIVDYVYTVTLNQSANPIDVEIYQDGGRVYSGTHVSEEITATVILTGEEGEHQIQVYQDGILQTQEYVTF
ncbi:MAG: Stk1 family PASTA domain-containing Ser/Thr kinase [Clostridia bacterium]|nr:Stk1 family PASTA domain-containing Ser/Thr kinase [Clostridia bacterium]